MSLPLQIRTAIRVISVPQQAERRFTFACCAEEAGIEWSFFDAHRTLAPGLVYDEYHVGGVYGRTLDPGELGCYSSHFALWQWLLASDYDQLVVLEDDVVADWPFIRELVTWDLAGRRIEYLRLFAKMPAPWRFVVSPYFDKYHHLIRYTGYPLGTQAYVLTKAGAQRLVRHGHRVEAPIDVYMDRTWDHGLLNLAVYPFPVYERHQRSSIGEGRFMPHGSRWSSPSLRDIWIRARRKVLLHWSIHGLPPATARSLERLLKE